MTQSQKIEYVNVRIGEIEFYIESWVYLKVSPLKDVTRFGKKGSLVAGMWDHIRF